MTDILPTVRKGQYAGQLDRDTFRARFMGRFRDPAFRAEDAALARLEAIAWDAYAAGRKAPETVKAGPDYADPDYDLSVEWKDTRDRLARAAGAQQDPQAPSRVLVIVGAARNDGTCPGEVSKSWRLALLAQEELRAADIHGDLLDLSRLTSEYEYRIHPCKGCVSTAMPLCHWPCSCYPNHALGQANDAMAGIYEQWVAAHGVILVAPTYWYQSPSPLKLMIDRLVCADGGNPDPTSTGGKDPFKAKQLELAGWPYPKHLAGRAYGLVVHGDVAGIESQRRALVDWLGKARCATGTGEPYACGCSRRTRHGGCWRQRTATSVARLPPCREPIGITQESAMTQKTLQDLFIHELSDIYSAEKQLTRALPKMARAASEAKLAEAFTSHLEETRGQVERIDKIVEATGLRLKRIKCAAMEGLVEEGRDVIEDVEKGPVLDAALIAAAQKVEHYEIASYGTLCTFAKQLGQNDALALLKETLAEEKAADEKLNMLALEQTNAKAARAGKAA